MKWAGIAYALVIALLSTPAGAQSDPKAELAKLKPEDLERLLRLLASMRGTLSDEKDG